MTNAGASWCWRDTRDLFHICGGSGVNLCPGADQANAIAVDAPVNNSSEGYDENALLLNSIGTTMRTFIRHITKISAQ